MTAAATPAPTWAHWTEPTIIEVDGIPTAYRRKGRGEPLLYLHGAGLTRAWLPLYEELSKHFDVIVPEHPGFGDSADQPLYGSVEDFVLHTDGLLRALGVTAPIHLVGHSLGGWIAADLAIFYPDRFASVTLLQPYGLRFPDQPSADPFRWTPEEAADHLLNGAAGGYAEYFDRGDPVEAAVAAYGESIVFARLAWNPRYDWRLEHRLARIAAPTTVIGFADDRFIPVAQARRWAELIPHARFELLEGSGGEEAAHLSIIQQPAALAELITRSAGH